MFVKRDYKGSDKSDIYSLGVVLYMMIYQQHPYLSEQVYNETERIYAIHTNKLKKPSQIAGFNIRFNSFLDILVGMVKRNPDDRLSFEEIL